MEIIYSIGHHDVHVGRHTLITVKRVLCLETVLGQRREESRLHVRKRGDGGSVSTEIKSSITHLKTNHFYHNELLRLAI